MDLIKPRLAWSVCSSAQGYSAASSPSLAKCVAKSVQAPLAERASATAHASAVPSDVDVALPSSSTNTRLVGLACSRMCVMS